MNKSKQRILIYRLGSLGDTIIVLPCFNKIRECFPDADITLLTNRPVLAKAAPLEAILGKEYFYDRVIDYPIGTRDLKILFNLLKQIRNLKIDTVINLTAARSKKSAVRDAWFFKLAGIKKLIGFPSADEDFKVCIDPTTGKYEWEAKRIARRLNVLGAIPLEDDQYWNMRLSPKEVNAADEILKTSMCSTPFLAIGIGTKVQSNDWEEQNWIGLVEKLKQKVPGWRLIIVGAEDEAERANRCIAAWGDNAVNLCGKTSPRVSAAILKQAEIFIGHDSGPTHLAACVGTPCVAIFGARNLPGRWYPRGNQNKIIYHETDCAGCGLEICNEQQKKCILSISIDEVQNAVIELLNNKKAIKH